MRFSARARVELDEIYDYSLKTWGLVQAEAYVAEIREVADAVGHNRQALKIRADLPGEFNYARSARHLLFFASDDEGLFVARILHEKMDIATTCSDLPPRALSPISRPGVGRTVLSPIWSGPEGSSHNDFAPGRSGSHRAPRVDVA